MFSKVIIADDLVSINAGVHTFLSHLGIRQIDRVNYCDDALLKIQAAERDGEPYELLITDLSFKTDHREQKLKSGEELAIHLKATYPDLKIIVYTIEDKPQTVRTFMQKHQVDGYVNKGRYGLQELSCAVGEVFSGKTYISLHLAPVLAGKSLLEIDDYDIALLKHLADGLVQDEISKSFKEQGIKPFSLSSIEKRLGMLRTQFVAKNGTQLVAKAKDLGLI